MKDNKANYCQLCKINDFFEMLQTVYVYCTLTKQHKHCSKLYISVVLHKKITVLFFLTYRQLQHFANYTSIIIHH